MGRIGSARLAGPIVMPALPALGFTYAGLSVGPQGIATVSADDSKGDIQSNCHTGSMFRGAGGNDKIQNGGEDCSGII